MSERPESGTAASATSSILWISALFLALAALFAIPFFIWGERFDAFLHQDQLLAWFAPYKGSAWLLAIGLLVADLILPIPNTMVIAALGVIYGPLLGGLVATVGTCLSGMFAYALCRQWGRPVAARLLGEGKLAAGDRFFARCGGLVVAASRWLPVLPEVISCMAGLSRMSPSVFFVALLCGSAPLCFTVAGLGHLGADRPLLVLALCGVLPVPVWLLVRRAVLRRGQLRRRDEKLEPSRV